MSGVELVGATDLGARTCAPTTPSAARSSIGASFVEVLDGEWRELLESQAVAATVQQWGRRHPAALAGCRTPDDVLAAVWERPDPVLIALLELVATGDQLAGRIVVQTMLPKLITMSRRDPDHDLSDYVSWLWLVMDGYPLARRRQRVAANLALDTLKQATRQRRDREIPYRSESLALLEGGLSEGGLSEGGRADQRWHSTAVAPDEAEVLTAATVIDTAAELGLLDELTVRVLTAVYDHGLPGKEAAARLGMSVDCVRWRCSRALRRLAVHSTDLLAAA